MFKKILLAVLVAAPMCLSAQTLKFGAVSPSEIFNVMPEVTTANNTLKGVQDKYAAQAKPIEDELQKKYGEYQELVKNKAPEATLEAKQKEITDLNTRYENFVQTAQKDLQQQQETLLAPIQQKLVNAIQAVGAEGGYAGILDAATLLYKGNNIEDVSAKVKAKLGIK
ncbi:MAG: OmpH family outer membrane protein [Muribaculaceae bacterium]|nr:OmpH family outer membrane protein [Muribaculaceae bacterium]MBR6488952.1 OmpH family outer membrane protein [Muribaculaceae bacterium]